MAELTGEAALAAGGTIANPTAARREVHAWAVAKSIAARADSSVLGSPAPDVDDAEQELPRKTRRTLAQLRSGDCLALNSYQPRMGWSDTPLCPCCRDEEHTTQHIFECPAHQTPLVPDDLWTHPVQAAEFLRGLPFMDLPESRRPPPNQETRPIEQDHRLQDRYILLYCII